MRYVIVKTYKGYVIIDLNKSPYYIQGGRYVTHKDDGRIFGNVVDSYSDPLEAVSEMTKLMINEMRKSIIEEVKRYERY